MFKNQKNSKTGFRWLRGCFLSALSHRKRPFSVANGLIFTGLSHRKRFLMKIKKASNDLHQPSEWTRSWQESMLIYQESVLNHQESGLNCQRGRAF